MKVSCSFLSRLAALLTLTLVFLMWSDLAAQCSQPAPYYGQAADDNFGHTVAIGGDLNADGYADPIVGTPFYDTPLNNSGLVTVYSGATGEVMYLLGGAYAGAQLGLRVSAAGDVNNDGYDDFLITQVDSARVFALSGLDASVLFVYHDPVDHGDSWGFALAAAGDLNLDGFDDVIVSAPNYDSAGTLRGRVYVFHGLDTVGNFFISRENADLILTGEGPEDYFGFSVAGGVDVSGDGVPDIIVGAPELNVDTGYVHVYSGATGGFLYRLSGENLLDQFGRAVTVLGDLNADMAGEVAVGAPMHGGSSTGKLYVISGATTVLLREIIGSTAGMRMGITLGSPGDVSGDGRADLVAGTLGDVARLYSAWDGVLLRHFTNPSTGFLFGEVVASGGDINNDGYLDLITSDRTNPVGGAQAGAAFVYYLGDQDGDGWEDFCDNCPATPNPFQEDDNGNSVGDACEVADTLVFYLFSPVHMVVADPVGDSIGLGFNTILNGSDYDTLTDFNLDTERDDIVSIPNPIAGEYDVRMIRDDGVPDSARFTLAIRINGNQLFEDEGYNNIEVAALGTTVPDTYTWTAATTLPGDANADGVTNSADIIYLVNHVFKGGPGSVVPGHGDVNCDDAVTSADIIYLVNYVFKGGASPCSQTGG